MQQGNISKKNGYLLIEAMVAMSVLITSVISIFALMSQSIKLTRVINDQYVGTYLAAEGIELVKNILDSNFLATPGNWNTGGFINNACYEIDISDDILPSSGCTNTPLKFDGTLYSYDPGADTGFSRSVQITPIVDGTGTQEGIIVISKVVWAGGESSIVLEDKFYEWHIP